MRMDKNNGVNKLFYLVFGAYFIAMVFFLLSSTSFLADADTSTSEVTIGNAIPEANVTVQNNASAFTLTESLLNNTLNCSAVLTDYNGEADISNATAVFYYIGAGVASTDPDDGNNKTSRNTTNTCTLNTSFGNSDQVHADCTMNVTYYAFNGTWICEVTVFDLNNTNATANDTININALIALNVSSTINFGTVDVFNVSLQNVTNITNTGNVELDLNIDAYAVTDGDGLAMNCTQGSNGTISYGNEGYNITSTPGFLSSAQFDNSYRKVSDTATFQTFNLSKRINNTPGTHDAKNATYWRVRIPAGVAGTCNGTVVLTAVFNSTN